ncbi:MAG: hypothetical protein K6F50_02255 [Kiritimatiellae bacterium]|nr:hypothetical protein [Kiritimatiellia bacterium]
MNKMKELAVKAAAVVSAMDRQSKIRTAFAAALIVAAACCLAFMGGGEQPAPASAAPAAAVKDVPAAETAPAPAAEIAEEKPKPAKSAKQTKRAGAKKGRAQRRAAQRIGIADRADLAPDEKRLLAAIEKAMDDENLSAIREILPEAAASANAEVRSDLVDALGWFGVKTMAELMPFMADADEDVRQSAIDGWVAALGEISDAKRRADIIEAAMQVVDDEGALESMTMELSDMEEAEALRVVVGVIEDGAAAETAVAAAREEYEFITGEEYTNAADASRWLEENVGQDAGEDSGDEASVA